jgi:hypothetical protein
VLLRLTRVLRSTGQPVGARRVRQDKQKWYSQRFHSLPVENGGDNRVSGKLRVVFSSDCKCKCTCSDNDKRSSSDSIHTCYHGSLRVANQHKLHVGAAAKSSIDVLDQVRCSDAGASGEVIVSYGYRKDKLLVFLTMMARERTGVNYFVVRTTCYLVQYTAVSGRTR